MGLWDHTVAGPGDPRPAAPPRLLDQGKHPDEYTKSMAQDTKRAIESSARRGAALQVRVRGARGPAPLTLCGVGTRPYTTRSRAARPDSARSGTEAEERRWTQGPTDCLSPRSCAPLATC